MRNIITSIILFFCLFCSGQNYQRPRRSAVAPSGSHWTILHFVSQNGTSISVSTTGANLVVVCTSNYSANPTISATGGMGFTQIKSVQYLNVYTNEFYALPTSGQTSISTTFTVVSGSYCSVCVLVVYNSMSTPALDMYNGVAGGYLTGGVTPTNPYELLVTTASFNNSSGITYTPPSGWTGSYASGTGSAFGLGTAYYIDPSTAFINPSISSSSTWFGNLIASFTQ